MPCSLILTNDSRGSYAHADFGVQNATFDKGLDINSVGFNPPVYRACDMYFYPTAKEWLFSFSNIVAEWLSSSNNSLPISLDCNIYPKTIKKTVCQSRRKDVKHYTSSWRDRVKMIPHK